MTRLLLCLILVVGLTPHAAHADPATDMLGVPGPVSFQDAQFDLAWTSHPKADYFKQEYVPAGQKVEHYDQMFIVEASNGSNPGAAAIAKIEELKKRAKSDAYVNYALISNSRPASSFSISF